MNRTKSVIGAVVILVAAANAAAGQEYESRIGERPGSRRYSAGSGADGWDSSFRLVFGVKALEQADWAPADAQTEISLMTDFGPTAWPVRIAVDLRYGAESADVSDGFQDFTFESATAELDLGVRKIWSFDSGVSLYVGGGLCLGWAEVGLNGSGENVSDSDSGAGMWLGLGLEFRLGSGFTFGLDLGSSVYMVDLLGVEADAGGGRFGFTLGWSF